MPPSAQVQRLLDEGWRVEQFGGALSPSDFEDYLEACMDQAKRWAEHHLGAAIYAGLPATSYERDCCNRAEVCFAASILWRRRASFFDAAGTHDLDSPAATERAQYLSHAQGAMECAQQALREAMRALGLPTDGIGGDWSGLATRAVETGPFPLMKRVPA